jgi:hypothetical protein
MIACAATHRYSLHPQKYDQNPFLDLDAHANLALQGFSVEASGDG